MRVVYYFRGDMSFDTDADGWVSRSVTDNNDLIYYSSEEEAVASMSPGDVHAPEDVHHETWLALHRRQQEANRLRLLSTSGDKYDRLEAAASQDTPMECLDALRSNSCGDDDEQIAQAAFSTITKIVARNLTTAADDGWRGKF